MTEVCGTCNEPLTGPFFDVDGKKTCEKCFEEKECPTCLHCKKKIKDEYLMAFEATYHKECFLCAECNTIIEHTYYQRNGSMICPPCNNRQDLVCIKCKVKGGSPMITVGKYKIPFHSSCFKCAECQKQLEANADFICKKNEILMPECFKKRQAAV